MRRTALAAAVAALLSTPAAASCYLEGSAGGTIAHNKLESAGQSVTIAGDGYTAGIGAGCDFALMDKFIAGPLVRVSLGGIDSNFMGSRIKTEVAYMGGARFGYLMNPNTRAYVLVGYQVQSLEIPQFASWDGKGLVLGTGLEIDIASNMRLGFEVDRVQLSGISDGGDKLKPAAYTGLVTVKYVLPSLFK